MGQKMVISSGVIWYALDESAWILVSPNRSLKEKCLLIGKEEKAVLDKLLRQQGRGKGYLDRAQMEIAWRWLKPEFQILEEVKDRAPDNLPNQLALSAFQEYVSARSMEVQHDLCDYYGSEIVDPANQFEEVEMTVSHLYRDPHPALDNMSYGARFAGIIMDENRLREGMKVLEVGGGTGIFGREFLREVKRRAPEVYGTMQYTFFDISPVLLKSQEENNREHRERVLFQTGNIRNRQGLNAGYDLVIANEMIADLPVVRMAREELDEDGPASEGWTMGKRLGLDFSDAPPLFILNLGALDFIVHLAGLLNPGGCAYIVEYGSTWAYPKAYQVGNHREHSIHFGHLLKAARELGLGARLGDLPRFLKFQGELEVLEDRCHRSLFDHLLPFLGVGVSCSKVYTREMLMERIPHIMPKIENLNFVKLETQDGIVYPKGFYVLILEEN
ncbi:MAG: class I SAM-dependent methyltransferase [Deltaproteobacteria bacterium]|nr:class I SAM-dependent methyltransferase [Deltaproteobacteria bacterium]